MTEQNIIALVVAMLGEDHERTDKGSIQEVASSCPCLAAYEMSKEYTTAVHKRHEPLKK